jgi:hypothetical protein
MFIQDPDFYPSQILLNFLTGTENFFSQFTGNYSTFAQIIGTKLSKIWVWDSGPGIRDPKNWLKQNAKNPQHHRVKSPRRRRPPNYY